MKKYILFGGYLLLLAYITSCDDGRIYEKTETLSEEGRTLKMSGKINGISKWPDGYSVVVASMMRASMPLSPKQFRRSKMMRSRLR